MCCNTGRHRKRRRRRIRKEGREPNPIQFEAGGDSLLDNPRETRRSEGNDKLKYPEVRSDEIEVEIEEDGLVDDNHMRYRSRDRGSGRRRSRSYERRPRR